ncbi:MAG: ABC transporter substrate-binding protein [Pseudomonadales bacterium]
MKVLVSLPAMALVNSLCGLLFAAAVLAEEETWPQAWFEPMQTASELGITQFSQSPYLDAQDLPPVAERLPDDPVVVVPLAEVGKYGGTARITTNEWLTFPNMEPPMAISADMRTILPNLAESWTVSPDGRRITLTLRKGIKWSDGVPLTSDDFLFTFNDIWVNNEYSPVPSRNVEGGKAVKVDDRTFYYEFKEPRPLMVNLLANYGDFFVDPAHYYKNYHPAYVERDTLNRKIKRMGFLTWMAFYYACTRQLVEESVDAPTLAAHRIVRHTPTLVRLERNPYYFKVDPAGQQLPYIDAIESRQINNKEVIAAMSSTGQLDFSAYELRTQDIPLLKLGERSGDIRVLVWNRLHSSDVVIQPNYNYDDKRLAALYWQREFREALSIAINRDEMNQIIYFGRGTPRQVTAHPSSSMFEPEFATAHTQYDKARANQLLDEIGLHDVNGDGLREYADGSQLTITLEFMDWETPKAITLELVSLYWREVGIDLRLKIIDASLQNERGPANEMQMSVWHADQVTDILLPISPKWWAPVASGRSSTLWNSWSRWYLTDGRLGSEPPPVMRELQLWAEEMGTTVDPARRIELGKKLLASNAQNLWTIGTVGLAPQPVVIARRLRGVPQRATWGWDNRWTMSYHPATWYFDSPGTGKE